MKQNEGTLDRVLRVVAGMIFLAMMFVGPQSAWFAIPGVILLLTGIVGFCPIYRIIGLRTCPVSP